MAGVCGGLGVSFLPFGNRVIHRAYLQRASLAFGGVKSSDPKGPAFRVAAQSEIAKYDAKKGGMWNYEDVITGLDEIARGADPKKLSEYIAGLTGAGEAQSKLSLLSAILEQTPIRTCTRVDVGSREVDLGDDVFLSVSYDLSIKVDETVYCYLIYPKAEPIKNDVRNALIAEFCAPFSGMTCAHKLVYVENPKIGDKRKSLVEFADFEFRAINENFRTFMKIFADELGL
jgi:hypothetical protein